MARTSSFLSDASPNNLFRTDNQLVSFAVSGRRALICAAEFAAAGVMKLRWLQSSRT